MNAWKTTLLLACATILAVALDARAQTPAKKAAPVVHKVAKDETLLSIAARLRYPSATENQMVYAIIRGNPNAFSVKTERRLLPGARLVIPDEATVLSYKPDVADSQMATLRKAEARYKDGLAAEKKRDMKGAVTAYIESARLGHPLADLRLGQLYDRDRSKTLSHDLQESILHYQKAREFGIDVKDQPARDMGAPGVPVH